MVRVWYGDSTQPEIRGRIRKQELGMGFGILLLDIHVRSLV